MKPPEQFADINYLLIKHATEQHWENSAARLTENNRDIRLFSAEIHFGFFGCDFIRELVIQNIERLFKIRIVAYCFV